MVLRLGGLAPRRSAEGLARFVGREVEGGDRGLHGAQVGGLENEGLLTMAMVRLGSSLASLSKS